MKEQKNNLDEMQEQKLRSIESGGYWLCFWGLLIAIFVQLAFSGGQDAVRAIAGEWIVFMVMSAYLLIRCLRNGIWDRKLKPDRKTNLAASLIAGAAVLVLMFVIATVRYHKPLGALAAGATLGVFSFLGCFAALSLSARAVKKRQEKLEQEPEEEE